MRALELIGALRASGVDDSAILNAVIAAEEAAEAYRRKVDAERQRRYRLSRMSRVTGVTPPPETKVPTPLKTQPPPQETPPIGGAKKPQKTRRQIIPGWTPSEQDLDYARKRGLLEAEICTETEKFRDHHLKTGSLFLDWNAAWRTWCQRVNEYAVKPRPNGSNGHSQPHPRHSFR